MKLINKSLRAIAIICLISACSTDLITESEVIADPEIISNNNTEFAFEVMNVVNEHRASLNLAPLEWHTDSEIFAVHHCIYMVERNEPSHDNFFERAEALRDMGASLVSENVAYGFRDARSVLEGWLGSPEHKEAIEGNYTHSGIGVILDKNDIPYYTQIFIK